MPAGYEVEGSKHAKRLVPAAERREVTRTRGRGGNKREITVTLPSTDDIRQAFADAATESTVTIGKRLGMSADGVDAMLRNRVYSTGRNETKRSDGVIHVHRCEPLVDLDTQDRAIAALERRRTGDNVTSRALAKDDFSGALYCASCDAGGAMYRYYSGGRKRADGTPGPRVRRYKCTECRKSVDAGKADAMVDAFMAARSVPWLVQVEIKGHNVYRAELARVKEELESLYKRGLDRRAQRAEEDRLWAEEDRLTPLAEQEIPTRHEYGFSGKSEGQRWSEMTQTSERRAGLISGEFRLFVKAKPGRTGAVDVELAYCDDDRPESGEAA